MNSREKGDFDQHLECTAPKPWLIQTTLCRSVNVYSENRRSENARSENTRGARNEGASKINRWLQQCKNVDNFDQK